MKKVALFIHSLRFGGAEKIVSLLLKNRDYKLFLCLIENKIQYDIDKTDNIIYFEKEYKTNNKIVNFIKIFLYAYRYKKFCNKNKIDCSISFLTRPNLTSIISKFFGNRSKIIVSEHSLPMVWYGNKSFKSFLAKSLIKMFYNHADEIIAVSDGVKEDLKRLGIREEKIKVVYNFIDKDKIDKKKLEKVDDLKFDKFTFVTIGRLDNEKNHQLIIKAMKKLSDNTQLLIIGDGELKDELIRLIDVLNLKDRVFLIGFRENPYKYLYNSHCFILSSKHESFGIVLLEAMVCNLPIISTDCPVGPREILSKNKDLFYEKFFCADYGILVQNGDEDGLVSAMKKIYEDIELRKKYGSFKNSSTISFKRNGGVFQ